MANIRIDTDGLQNNISSMRAYVNELDSLNAADAVTFGTDCFFLGGRGEHGVY